jgi:WD repeat-containing protein 44
MDKTVRLWHVSRTECLCCFKHSDFVTSIQFHPRDDRFFLAGSLDSKLRLWSIPDKSVAYWTNVPDMVTAVTFTPDGKTAVAGCLNGLCMFYETEGLKPYTQIHVRSARGRNAKGSKITGMDTITLPPNDPNGEVKLLITSNDSRVRLYNFKDRNLEVKFRGNENTCSQIHATFSDDGRYVICGSEDRKAYIWPTMTVDKEQDKRPVEVFEAHSAIVTTAILAPTKTRQLLGASGDPVYDLCNPPPVTLVERVGGSNPSSKPPTENGVPHSEITLPPAPLTQEPTKPPKPEESPTYLARSSHINGNIIVTADYTGSIKIFRQDCAYQKRQSSWETNSTMAKKLLGRSNSVATRTSVSSASRRDSLTKHPSTDRILSWRSSITPSTHGSLDSLKNGQQSQRTRSTSPRKSASVIQTTQHSSPRHGSTPLVTTTPSISTTSPRQSLNQTPPEEPAKDKDPTHLVPSDAAKENPATHVTAIPPTRPTKGEYSALPMHKDDPLMLQGEQSYMYWDRAHYAAQATAIPRTPGLLEPNSFMQLERKNSVVSTLSSEMSFKEGGAEGEGLSEEEDLKCGNCGGTSFRAKRDQKLICNDCGSPA